VFGFVGELVDSTLHLNGDNRDMSYSTFCCGNFFRGPSSTNDFNYLIYAKKNKIKK
jgi:hypothetical protein